MYVEESVVMGRRRRQVDRIGCIQAMRGGEGDVWENGGTREHAKLVSLSGSANM